MRASQEVPVRQLIRFGAALMAILLVLALAQSGMLASLDRRLSDWRYEESHRPTSGNTVVIEIDSKSIAEVGVWPWPRSLHARLLDRLMEAGADEVVFDIDFSSASSPFEDAIFAAALERAGGYAWLAAFAQTDANGEMHFSRPLPEFSAASPVLVNVLLDPMTGLAHAFPTAAGDDQGTIPALAAHLARSPRSLPAVTEIDFSLDLSSLPRFSFTDILYGRTDLSQLAGKQVIVGASAIELRDFFSVPRHDVIPGPVLQALALETVKADRILSRWGSVPGLLATAVLALAMLFRQKRIDIPTTAVVLVSAAIAGEVLGLIGFARFGIIVDTATLHVGLVMLFVLALVDNGYHHLRARRAAQQRLEFLATHDAATGLLSQQGLLGLSPPASSVSLVLLQIRSMDELRATLGHEVIDALLAQFVHRLRHVGSMDLARVAPSRFAVIRSDDGDADRLAAAAEQLCDVLSGTYRVDGHNLHIEVIAGYAAGQTSRAALLNQAETALIEARAGRLRLRNFNPSDQIKLDRHRQLDRDLRLALEHDQVHLLFQPKVWLNSGRIVGVEALMRWEHPELGLISPLEFIPLAEETGLIVDLGRWIIEEACRQAMTWPQPITVAVNVSAVQLQFDDLFEAVRVALQRTGLPPDRLELEITESGDVGNAAVQETMWQLQDMGVRLSIDDFGTGYSSLSYFRDLPFDTVKIDQSFVRGRTTPEDRRLLAAIVELAAKLDKHTVAEGIEDAATAHRLAALGCTFGQGYHFGRPMPGSELIERLEAAAAVSRA